MRPLAVLSTARLVWAVVLLAAPGPTLRLLGGVDADAAPWPSIARTLGARQLLQGAIQLRACVFGADARPLLGAGVDALHGLSDLTLAATDRRHLRVASIDGAIAAACVTVEALVARGAS